MTNERLAELIQEGGNDELLPLLWEKTRRLIYKKCRRIWRFYSETLERFGYSFDDLQQEGYNALIFAVKGFKIEKGYKFTSYLNYALKTVVRGLLSGGADVLNQPGTQSLEQPLAENKDGDPLFISDIVPDESAEAAFEKIERLDEYRPLYNAIHSLTDNERHVILDYYFKGLTYKQIGKRLNLSAERVRRLHNDAIRVLQRGESSAKLISIYGAEYKGHNKLKARNISSSHK